MNEFSHLLDHFFVLAIRFGFNILAIAFVVFLYSRISRRKEFYFSYFAICIAGFLLVFLLENIKIEFGFALGLFAIFGIIRYCTDTIPPNEMTYLFVTIAVSVINGILKDEKFGVWIEFEFNKKVVKHLEFSLIPEIRFKNNYSFDAYIFEGKLS